MALTPSELRRRKMNLLMAMSYAAFASTKASTWSPTLLFSAGEQGAWYDPSDFSTMFQDAAGTTPVTAVEQPVGLLLDKSKGLALGAELVTNGDFSGGTTGWTTVAANSISVVSGQLKAEVTSGVDAAYFGQSVSVVAGKWYEVKFATISDGTSKIARLFVGGFWSGTPITPNAFGSYTVKWQATSTGGVVFWPYGTVGGTGTYILCDNISVRELPGNHASQSTAASRPVLSARVNLLTYSEQFDNAAWTKAAGVTVSANTDIAPDGTLTADTLTSSGNQLDQSVSCSTNTVYTDSLYFKKTSGAAYQPAQYLLFSGGTFVIYAVRLNTDTGVATAVSAGGFTAPSGFAVQDVGGYWRLSISGNSNNNTTASLRVYANLNANGGAGAGSQIIWGADLRVTNDGVGLPAYQRIAAATDYDTTGFPLYLKFDGTDDSLATGTIDPGAVDKAQVFAGVRKLSAAGAFGIVAEMGSSVLTSGTLNVAAPGGVSSSTENFSFAVNGSQITGYDAVTYTAPITSVLSCAYDIGGSALADEIKPRINGVVPGTLNAGGNANAGTGNFTSQVLNVGARNAGAELRFRGHLYSLILRFGANLDAATTTSTETWVNSKTGAY